jgi:CIC family chloride channel protein
MPRSLRGQFTLAGTAAGLGAIFKAPLAGALTSVEVLYKKILSRVLLPLPLSLQLFLLRSIPLGLVLSLHFLECPTFFYQWKRTVFLCLTGSFLCSFFFFICMGL